MKVLVKPEILSEKETENEFSLMCEEGCTCFGGYVKPICKKEAFSDDDGEDILF